MRALSTAIAFMAVAASTTSAQMANTGGGRPSVSPDGRWITFSALRDGEWEIYVIHPDGTGARRITNVRERNFVNLGPPTWIGNRVLIWQRLSDTTRLSLVDVPGDPPTAPSANAARLQVPFDAVQIRPSPDGRRLVFLHGDRRLPRIAIANIDGSDLHDIVGGRTPVGNPDWSRDGNASRSPSSIPRRAGRSP